MTKRAIGALAAVALAAGLLAACGGGGEDTNTTGAEVASTKQSKATTRPAATTEKAPAKTETTAAASAQGEQVFKQDCASCHTLSAAGSNGQAGPNLDQLQPSESTVATQVTNGGGRMPAFKGQLSAAQIQAVASYVSKSAGS